MEANGGDCNAYALIALNAPILELSVDLIATLFKHYKHFFFDMWWLKLIALRLFGEKKNNPYKICENSI